jgi:hypothetical protein
MADLRLSSLFLVLARDPLWRETSQAEILGINGLYLWDRVNGIFQFSSKLHAFSDFSYEYQFVPVPFFMSITTPMPCPKWG